MERKILALGLAQYLVFNGWTVYVSCANYVDVTVHLDESDVVRLRAVLDSIAPTYHFCYEFTDRSDVSTGFFVCHCSF